MTMTTPQEFVEGDLVGFDNFDNPFTVYAFDGTGTPTNPDVVTLRYQVEDPETASAAR